MDIAVRRHSSETTAKSMRKTWLPSWGETGLHGVRPAALGTTEEMRQMSQRDSFYSKKYNAVCRPGSASPVVTRALPSRANR